MRRCFYHTELGQNAVFHNFARQINSFNIQDDRSTRGLLTCDQAIFFFGGGKNTPDTIVCQFVCI